MTTEFRKIRIRRGSIDQLPILLDGELGYVDDPVNWQVWIGSPSGVNKLLAQNNSQTGSNNPAPNLVSINPAGGNISTLTQSFVATFDIPMNIATSGAGFATSIANKDNWLFSAPVGNCSVTSVDNVTSTSVTIHTTGSGVPSGTAVALTATAVMQSAAGVALGSAIVSSYAFTFVAPADGPTITAWSPVGGNLSSTLPLFLPVITATLSKAMNVSNSGDPTYAGSVKNPANWNPTCTSGQVSIGTPITVVGNVVSIPLTTSGILDGSDLSVSAQPTITDSTGNPISGTLDVHYHLSLSSGSTTTSPNFQASQEADRKPAPNYALNLGPTLATQSCKNQIVGALLRLVCSQDTSVGVTGLPAGFTLSWYKALPVAIPTSSVVGGPTGTHYDALVQLPNNVFKVATPGTSETNWLWLDITVASSVAAGDYTFTLTAGGFTIAVTHKVINATIPATPIVPLHVPINGWLAALGTYGAGDADEANLGIRYSQLLNAHRLSAFAQQEFPVGLVNTGDPSQGLALGATNGFNTTNKPFTLGAPLCLPIKSAYDQSFTAGTNALKWISDNQLLALEAELNKPANSAMKANHWNYYIDEPDWTVSGLEAHLVTELTNLKTKSPSSKVMMTSEIRAAFIGSGPGGIDLVDVWCPIMGFVGQSGHTTKANYAGKGFWLYGACLSHGGCNGAQFNPDGSPDLMIDRESYHAVAYLTVPYAMGATGSIYYATAISYYSYDGTPGDATDPLTNVKFFGGNGDGILVYPGRKGFYGLTVDGPLASIRLKHLRKGSYLCDMMHLAGVDGSALVTDGLTWRQSFADIVAFEKLLGVKLNGGTMGTLPGAVPGEFFLTRIQAIAGSNNVTAYPPTNKLGTPTKYELFAGTVSGGPYTRLCGTKTGSGTIGTTFILSDSIATSGGVAGTTYFYKIKATNASGSTWSETELSATLLAANTTGPGAIANLALWYQADKGVTKDGSNLVSGWLDQGPAGYPLSQSGSTHKPTFVAAAYNNGQVPCLRFTGAGVAGTSVSAYKCLDSGQTPISPYACAQTVFVVHNPADATTVMDLMCDQVDTNHRFQVNRSGKAFSIPDSASFLDATTAAATGLQIAAYTSTAAGFDCSGGTGQAKLYLDGVLDKTGSTNNSFPIVHWMRVGAGASSGSFGATPATNWYAGDICEIIVYYGVLSSTDFNSVINYLQTKYGLT